MLPEPEVVEAVRALLRDAKVTQYQLRQAGIAADTSRMLLGAMPGTPNAAALDAALALIGRRLWHQRRPRA